MGRFFVFFCLLVCFYFIWLVGSFFWSNGPSVRAGYALQHIPNSRGVSFTQIIYQVVKLCPTLPWPSSIYILFPTCFLPLSLNTCTSSSCFSYLHVSRVTANLLYNDLIWIFNTGNFCHFHLWSRVCLKNLGCWVLLSLQRMEGETQICQKASVHAG